ncbi:MAG: SDR family oxidoreductase, partial [Nannocystaceae bacterium]
RCEAYLARAAQTPARSQVCHAQSSYHRLAPLLRGALGPTRYLFDLRSEPEVRRFVDRSDLAEVACRGPVTPDHVIRTKQVPLIVDTESPPSQASLRACVEAFRTRYRAYVQRMLELRRVTRTPLDPDPRVALLPGIGLVGIGRTAKAARVAADLYTHTISVIEAAQAIGSYQALPDEHIFDMEYWSLEQAKLGKKKPQAMAGTVVYVSGAARGIGAATAKAFAQRGAQLFLVDRDGPAVKAVAEAIGAGWATVDMCDAQQVRQSVNQVVERYGGLDGVVSNAGTAPQSPIDECSEEVLEHSLAINLKSHQTLAAAATGVLKAQGHGGFLLFNVSKAALNPGKNFGPYAVAKAGLLALTKQYALEGGPHGIRASAVNADRVRTGLLPADMVAARAKARGLDADAYFRSNLLAREVAAEDVAQAFVFLAEAPSTTGAVLTVDGGNVAASVR